MLCMTQHRSFWRSNDLLQVAKSLEEAKATCKEDETSAPCAVAWDEYEELAAEAAHARDRKKLSQDPLEAYCADNPETDECRVYEDWQLVHRIVLHFTGKF